MIHRTEPGDSLPDQSPMTGVGSSLTAWIVLVFVATMVVFVGLDIHHEIRFAESLGAGLEDRAILIMNTLTLHAVHAGVTVLAFGLAIHFLVRRLVSRRIARIVLAIEQFRRGTWRVRIPTQTQDEIEWLTAAFRQLGPDLDRKLTTFVEVDRKSVVALLGSRYESRVAPPTRQIIATAREEMRSGGTGRAWHEVEMHALQVLAELASLGRPDHPATADIVNLKRSSKIVSSGSRGPAGSPGVHRM